MFSLHTNLDLVCSAVAIGSQVCYTVQAASSHHQAIHKLTQTSIRNTELYASRKHIMIAKSKDRPFVVCRFCSVQALVAADAP